MALVKFHFFSGHRRLAILLICFLWPFAFAWSAEQKTRDLKPVIAMANQALPDLLSWYVLATNLDQKDPDAFLFFSNMMTALHWSQTALVYEQDEKFFRLKEGEPPRLMATEKEWHRPIFINESLLARISNRDDIDFLYFVAFLGHEWGHKSDSGFSVALRDLWIQKFVNKLRPFVVKSEGNATALRKLEILILPQARNSGDPKFVSFVKDPLTEWWILWSDESVENLSGPVVTYLDNHQESLKFQATRLQSAFKELAGNLVREFSPLAAALDQMFAEKTKFFSKKFSDISADMIERRELEILGIDSQTESGYRVRSQLLWKGPGPTKTLVGEMNMEDSSPLPLIFQVKVDPKSGAYVPEGISAKLRSEIDYRYVAKVKSVVRFGERITLKILVPEEALSGILFVKSHFYLGGYIQDQEVTLGESKKQSDGFGEKGKLVEFEISRGPLSQAIAESLLLPNGKRLLLDRLVAVENQFKEISTASARKEEDAFEKVKIERAGFVGFRFGEMAFFESMNEPIVLSDSPFLQEGLEPDAPPSAGDSLAPMNMYLALQVRGLDPVDREFDVLEIRIPSNRTILKINPDSNEQIQRMPLYGSDLDDEKTWRRVALIGKLSGQVTIPEITVVNQETIVIGTGNQSQRLKDEKGIPLVLNLIARFAISPLPTLVPNPKFPFELESPHLWAAQGFEIVMVHKPTGTLRTIYYEFPAEKEALGKFESQGCAWTLHPKR